MHNRERLTVTLSERATQGLTRLAAKHGASKTGIMRRAVTLYAYLDKQLDGDEFRLLLRNSEDGSEVEIVNIFG